MAVAEAAQRLQVHITRVRVLLRRGQLVGKKIGRDWVISEADLKEYQARRRPRQGGRPSHSKI
jgi:excisionase family DNA binding protein